MLFLRLLVQLALCLVLSGLLFSTAHAQNPADQFDLRFWKLQLPVDENNDGKVDEVDVRQLGDYSHPDFFYLHENGLLVMTAPN